MPDEPDDIAGRLRGILRESREGRVTLVAVRPETLDRAADAIEARDREIERLRDERDSLIAHCLVWHGGKMGALVGLRTLKAGQRYHPIIEWFDLPSEAAEAVMEAARPTAEPP